MPVCAILIGMRLRVSGGIIAVFAFAILFFACGEMTSLIPSSDGYQAGASVNGNSLDDSSILRSADKIRPYFLFPVRNDPDLAGLLVYVQNLRGEAVGEMVLYVLRSHVGDFAVEENADETEGRVIVGTRNVPERAALLVAIESFEQDIPYFPLPETMEKGIYSLVFEAIGNNETLSRTEKDVFFLGDAAFSLNDVSMYVPNASGTRLIPPGTAVLLESTLNFDSSLDPYAIWYNDKTIIREGKIREGAGTMLWKVPDQAGFYTLRLEVLPFQVRRNTAGVSREIILPVSSSAAESGKGYFFANAPDFAANSPLALGTIFPEMERVLATLSDEDDAETLKAMIEPVLPPQMLKLYQFAGNLNEAKAASDASQSFASASENAPRWATTGQSYGLSVGADDAYLLPPVAFFPGSEKQGGGAFLLFVNSLADSTVFRTFFPSQTSPNEGVLVEIRREGNAFVLNLATRGTAVAAPVYVAALEPSVFTPIVLEFYILPYRFEAKLSVGEYNSLQSASESIPLAEPLSGKGSVILGGGEVALGSTGFASAEPVASLVEEMETDQSVEESETAESEQPKLKNEANSKPEMANTTIWNEFAILRTTLPLQSQDFLVTAIDEAKAALEAESVAEESAHEADGA